MSKANPAAGAPHSLPLHFCESEVQTLDGRKHPIQRHNHLRADADSVTMTTDSGTSRAPVQWHPISLLRDSRHRSIDGIDFTDKSEDGRKIRFALLILNQPLTNYLGIIKRLWNNGLSAVALSFSLGALLTSAQHSPTSLLTVAPTASLRRQASTVTAHL